MQFSLTPPRRNRDPFAPRPRSRLSPPPPDEPLERLARLARAALSVPVSVITLTGRTRQIVGGMSEAPRSVIRRLASLPNPLTDHVITTGEPLLIEDLRVHPLGRDNGVLDLGVLAYAGMPLWSPEGRVLGSVSTLDFCPRRWQAKEISVLEDFAAAAARELQLQVDAALREREERYRAVIEATQSAVWDWDLRTSRVLWNGASRRLLRYAPGEMRPRIDWWVSHLHPEDRARAIESLNDAIQDASDSWSEQYRFLRGDGTYATVLDCGWILRDARGRAVRVIGSMRDVTERVSGEQAQRVLAEASVLLEESLDVRPALTRLARLVVPTLADICVIDVLEGERLCRWAVAHVDPGREKALHSFDRPLADPDREGAASRAIRTGEPVLIAACAETDLTPLGADPEALSDLPTCSLIAVPLVAHEQTWGVLILIASGPTRRYRPRDLVTAADLARRAALALEHAHLYEQAQEAIQAREEVLAVVSHDLKNPLSTVKMSAALLLDTSTDRRSVHVRSLEMINRAADEMNYLIESLLDASRLEAGQFQVEPDEQEADVLVEEVQGLLRPLAEQQSVRLSAHLPEDLPPVAADSHQILRVFSNLVGNAIKFTPEGGTVAIGARNEDGRVCFQVSDSGPGIPEEQLPHIFDRFWQARKGDRRGTGLGLAIAQGIVEAHGGTIWARSREGEGTTFSFTLPIGGTQSS